jgi:cold shock CspA family protein
LVGKRFYLLYLCTESRLVVDSSDSLLSQKYTSKLLFATKMDAHRVYSYFNKLKLYMGRSQETFSKKEKEKKKIKKRKEKELKRQERKENSEGGGLDNMTAYVDELGNITDTPPEEQKKSKIKAENIELGVPKRDKEEMQTDFTGQVAFYNDSKGFGFIREDNSGEKYFFHINNVNFEIQENDKVTFELARGRKGMDAVNVQKG